MSNDEIVTIPRATSNEMLFKHLHEVHEMPTDVLNNHEPNEHEMWHEAEHKTREAVKGEPLHAGHLRHTHPKSGA